MSHLREVTHLDRVRLQGAAFFAAATSLSVAAGALAGGIVGAAWLTGSLILLGVEAIILFPRIGLNTDSNGCRRKSLGAANMISLVRGWLIAAAGALAVTRTAFSVRGEAPGLAYIPGLLYTLALVLDLADGAVARRTGTVTPLGRELENEIDSLGVLVISAALVAAGRVPAIIGLAGIARYLFVLGIWFRRRRGLPVNPLVHSKSGRIIAGFMMIYLSVSLWPVLPQPVIDIAGVAILIPFAAGFVRDWLAVIGVSRLGAFSRPERKVALERERSS